MILPELTERDLTSRLDNLTMHERIEHHRNYGELQGVHHQVGDEYQIDHRIS